MIQPCVPDTLPPADLDDRLLLPLLLLLPLVGQARAARPRDGALLVKLLWSLFWFVRYRAWPESFAGVATQAGFGRKKGVYCDETEV